MEIFKQSEAELQFEDDRKNGKEPVAPEIPSEIIQTITQRYVIAYDKLTGLSL